MKKALTVEEIRRTGKKRERIKFDDCNEAYRIVGPKDKPIWRLPGSPEQIKNASKHEKAYQKAVK